MAKYGIETFKDNQPLRFSLSQDEVYGKLFFSKIDVQEIFEYIDEDGVVHSRDEEERHNLLSRTQGFIRWTPRNTHEVEGKSLIAYSEKLDDFMDIKLPIDFDETQFGFEEELKLVNPTYTVNTVGYRLDKKFVFHVAVDDVVKADKAPTQAEPKPKSDKK